MFSTGDDFSSVLLKEYLTMHRDIFVVTANGEVAASVLWVEARSTAKHHTMHRTDLYNKELSGPRH